MEERAGVGRLHQRRRVERTIAEAARDDVEFSPEASITREGTNDPGRMIGNILDASVEIRVARYRGIAGQRGRGSSVSVAHVAPFLIEEELPALLRQGAFQDQRVQVQIRLATQGELERLQGIQLLRGRQAEVLALHPPQGLRDVLPDGSGRHDPQVRPFPSNVSLKKMSRPLAMSASRSVTPAVPPA